MASQEQPSFQKRIKSKILQIPGCRPSLYNNQLLVSTGIPSLDSVIGGGLAVGTVLLIEEDRYGNYAKIMFKYFLAEAIVTGHKLVIGMAAADITGQSLLRELPQPISNEPTATAVDASSPSSSTEDLKIAWRYQNLPQQASGLPQMNRQFGHYFDMSKSMPQQMIVDNQPTIFDASDRTLTADEGYGMNPAYRDVLHLIRDEIDTGQFSTSANPVSRNILKLGLHGLGSPFWGEGCLAGKETGYDPSLARFLLALRRLLRSAYAVCLITVPSHTLQDDVMTDRLRHLTDTVVRLESFAGSEKESNPIFKDYHGLFHVVKLSRLNSLVTRGPDTCDLAFKLRRKKFTIEKLHLPPELSETVSRSQDEPDHDRKPTSSLLSCSSLNKNKLLEF